jgi:hypothetical protein
MLFTSFTNPYRNPVDVPEEYRKQPAIAPKFRPDGKYLNMLEDPATLWAIDLLYKEYRVPLNAMEIEAVATTDRTDKTSRLAFARADLIIYSDRYIAAGGGPKDSQKQKELGDEVEKHRSEAKQSQCQAEVVVAAAKARVEQIILGEEVGDD